MTPFFNPPLTRAFGGFSYAILGVKCPFAKENRAKKRNVKGAMGLGGKIPDFPPKGCLP
jgi:hypothetical protein